MTISRHLIPRSCKNWMNISRKVKRFVFLFNVCSLKKWTISWECNNLCKRNGSCMTINANRVNADKNLHRRKLTVSVRWSMAGLIHFSFLPKGVTINSASYFQEIDQMHQTLIKQHSVLANRKEPILLYDNTQPHISMQRVN